MAVGKYAPDSNLTSVIKLGQDMSYMKKIIIFAILFLLIVAAIYVAKGGLFLNNVADFACGKLKPGAHLNFAIALINNELGLNRHTFYDAGDFRIQLENGVLVNKKSDKYNMFCYGFFKDTFNPCNSAYGKIYLTYIKEKGSNFYRITEINYIYSPRPLFGYRIRIQTTNPGNRKKYFFERKIHRCRLLHM
jgi:hypothetical protein